MSDANQPICQSILLPLLKESINSHAMVTHCLKVIKAILHSLNPEQVPVVTADQPVFALLKQVQWHQPSLFGEDKFVIMMGSLHIEMAFINTLGDWLEGCEWVDILALAEIETPGTAESLLSGGHVKRSRYAHQVSAASLSLLLRRAWNAHNNAVLLSFPEWVSLRCNASAQFKYW